MDERGRLLLVRWGQLPVGTGLEGADRDAMCGSRWHRGRMRP